jgi:hypothetical protein
VKLLDKFSKITGLKINFSKTLAVKINLDLNLSYNLENGHNIQWQNNGKFTLLGMKYDLDQDDLLSTNYKNKIKE